MKTLLKRNSQILLIMFWMITMLNLSACKGKPETGHKENVPAKTPKDKIKPPETDLFTAALFGDLKNIEQHIAAGTDLNAKDSYGSTPLIIAATFGKTKVATALIEAGANVNLRNNDGATALHSAAFLCHVDIVKALLDNGADKTIKNNFGSTALESVSGPFEEIKPIYNQFGRDLGPLGLKLDYGHIKSTRPEIAEILK